MSYARKKGDGLCCKRVGQEGSFFCLLCHCEKVHVDIDVYFTYVYIHVHIYALWMDGWLNGYTSTMRRQLPPGKINCPLVQLNLRKINHPYRVVVPWIVVPVPGIYLYVCCNQKHEVSLQ